MENIISEKTNGSNSIKLVDNKKKLPSNKVNLNKNQKSKNLSQDRCKDNDFKDNKTCSVYDSKIFTSNTSQKFSQKKLSIPIYSMEQTQKYKTKKICKASSLPKNLEAKMSNKDFVKIKESKKEFSTTEFMLREKEHLERKKKKIEMMEKETLIKELSELRNNPRINPKSKKIAGRDTNDLYTRNCKFTEKIELNRKAKIEAKKNIEAELIEEVKKKYQGIQVDITEKYRKLLNWKNNKELNIKAKKQEFLNTINEICTFKPDIDMKSKRINDVKKSLNTASNVNCINKLYLQDRLKIKHKKEILKNIYTPTFSPMINQKYSIKNTKTNVNCSFSHTLGNINLNNSFQKNTKSGKFTELVKFNSQYRYTTRNYSSNCKNKALDCSYSSDRNEELALCNDFFTEVDTREVDNLLKERFKNVFKKYK